MGEVKAPRAWYKPMGVMLQPEKVEGINFETKTISVYMEMDGRGFHRLRLSDFELMWPTYLKDRNGKEIYGGDVCKMVILGREEEFNPLQALLQIIEWNRGAWGFKPAFPDMVHEDDREWRSFVRETEYDWDTNYFEIIGNIYENPNLIGG